MSTKKGSKYLEDTFGPLTFADLLLMEREDAELSQVAMAEKLGITKQKLCDFEKGRRLPSPKMAASWAKKLKHPQEVWVQIVLQAQLRRDKLRFKVSVA
ncbi:MAG: helix-turn-helix transcriptional regulator [Bdellovibrionales bacterium]|nr:helix-turn-helix domain-containing protein [Bdellovibrionales bacterium]NQZ18312.1 helix-turn-helix transcriptional regulator [Bdellovibrionales bacterium]